jgi:hypothetical protein
MCMFLYHAHTYFWVCSRMLLRLMRRFAHVSVCLYRLERLKKDVYIVIDRACVAFFAHPLFSYDVCIIFSEFTFYNRRIRFAFMHICFFSCACIVFFTPKHRNDLRSRMKCDVFVSFLRASFFFNAQALFFSHTHIHFTNASHTKETDKFNCYPHELFPFRKRCFFLADTSIL